VKEIVQKEHPVLREQAREVPPSEITSAKIKKILDDMKEALAAQEDGIAIAAPQINVPLRIFIVSKKIHEIEAEEQKSLPQQKEKTSRAKTQNGRDLVFINPQMIKLSKGKHWVPEGCLSVRWLYGKVKRADKATVRAYDEHGKPFTRGASGILAQIFQHEIDHLDGILFIDKAKELEELDPAEVKKNFNEKR
jgi:peptide deformylase